MLDTPHFGGGTQQRSHVLYDNIAAVLELERFFELAVAAAAQRRKLDGWQS
jgi:hypothetical protein